MIIYQTTKRGFLDDILSNDIENIVREDMVAYGAKRVGLSELTSWKNSLQYMSNVLHDADIPDDCNIAIEYHIPQTSKRLDFIITGQNADKKDHAILIELKQWSEAELTDKDSLVKTRFKGGNTLTPHPSYQAWSYAALLHGFNQTVYEDNIQLQPCAYLHNYTDDGIINHPFYQEYIDKAPLFLKSDALKLRNFIKQFVKYGDKSNIMYRIDAGKIKPSKSLSDSIASMIKGNQEFVLIDDQKVVYETALALAQQSSVGNKNVLIVEGGPGTGKSVVAVNLLTALLKKGLNARYVTKNAAPRAVYQAKLTGTLKKTVIGNLFTGSGAFIGCEENVFEALIVDEAHRLNEKSGMFKNLGENQIKEIIQASVFSVFFIDEDQKVTLHDIGDKNELLKYIEKEGAAVHQLNLSSQFRCNGSDGYLAWLDNTLQIKETANTILDTKEYDFKVFSSPAELRDAIFEKNKINNKARLVAGYCWDWASKKDPKAFDISFPDNDFAMRWNLETDGSLWIVSPESVSEVGCIHTCQGLEVDYIGVIVGEDLIVRHGEVITDASKRSKNDSSVRGYKSLMKKDPIETTEKLDRIIKNTYRTLMTRGMKGCYVYFVDSDTNKWFNDRIETN
ncbi:MAG: family ATPase [Sphingobacteriales bacterium]|nr:family ATPase [Sphingobacteriales bacterium]